MRRPEARRARQFLRLKVCAAKAAMLALAKRRRPSATAATESRYPAVETSYP